MVLPVRKYVVHNQALYARSPVKQKDVIVQKVLCEKIMNLEQNVFLNLNVHAITMEEKSVLDKLFK